MKDLGIIRRLFYRKALSLSEIERRTGLTRKTVRRWINVAEGTAPKYPPRAAGSIKIAPFEAQLTHALEVDARRPKRERRTALKLFGELQAVGFDGAYSRATEFVRPWRGKDQPWAKPSSHYGLNWAKASSLIGAKSTC